MLSATARDVMSGADVPFTGNVLGEANMIQLSSKLLRNLEELNSQVLRLSNG